MWSNLEILELVNDQKNSLEIKKKISIILSLLSGMLNYSDLKNNKKSNLTPVTKFANLIFDIMWTMFKPIILMNCFLITGTGLLFAEMRRIFQHGKHYNFSISTTKTA